MTNSTAFDYTYGFSQENATDEAYFAAGTHRLPQISSSIASTRQIEQDIDEGLQQLSSGAQFSLGSSRDNTQALDDPIDLSSFELSLDFEEQWMNSIAGPSMPVTQATSFNSQDNFIPTAPKRVDSGLRATAKPFVPSSQQWQTQQTGTWTPLNNNSTLAAPTSQPRDRNRMSHMTPIQTSVTATYQTPPLSAPSRSNIYAAQQHALATSPLISLTDETCVTSFPHAGGQGYQWTFSTPPALDIDTWAQGTRDFVDPARLTPVTPTTPTYGGSNLERTASRTSKTSRTTLGPYICDHEGCGKEFRSKTEFSHHKRNHGERHHVCCKCSKRFVFRKDLGRHEKVHTHERYHFGDVVEGCQWCVKGFQRKDHHKRHMKNHFQKGDVLTPAGSSAAMSRTHSGP